ncbi:efflux RND transporter periplasmic adaptor subunit [Belnapia sp. T18]|uniref:Efflux RND transporter periplasmic adaptor subunit n=1 Tax=Belnapia arida TaxID=2804533 RepID=A0ABS1TVC5_9PROT|nr:HlyD family efflux transporter periplasmic adaptor subunit [Belnapia arida]MBL6076396.1 efflux RND transporter periplasmic adaptor subunit [Belnapia arida]
MKRRAALLGLLLVALTGAGLAWVRLSAREAAPITSAEAAPLPPPGVGALGRVEPASRIRRLNPPGGMAVTRLDRLLVTEGDRVEAGQLIAEFGDLAQKEAAIAQAEAQLAQSRAELARIRAAGRPEEVAAQRARIDALRFAESSARRDAERAEALVPSGAGGAAPAERARFAAARTAAERAEAEATLQRLLVPRPEDLAVAETEVLSAEAALAKARADATLSRVTAPIAGTILKIYARPGDQVGSDGLLDLADLTRLDVVADVYETDVPRLRQGAPAEVIVPGDPRRYPAELREIGWLVRRTTQAGTDPVAAVDARTVEVRLTLSPEGRAALERRAGMQVQVSIQP